MINGYEAPIEKIFKEVRMKVLTFSKKFPKGHPRAGEETWFIQKILHSLITPQYEPATGVGWPPKFHAIRSGSRFKAGDMASLRVWSDKPYRSKQIEFAQVEVKKVWPVEINVIQTSPVIMIGGNWLTYDAGCELAKNDGLTITDFISWFNIHPKKKQQVFTGQIICWSDKITY